jgi:SAM-dependent methyltransferase
MHRHAAPSPFGSAEEGSMPEFKTPSFAGPNAEQIRYWNEAAGETWATREEALDQAIAPISDRALVLASAQLGENVIDIGCGCGATTVELARRVGSKGTVLGVDVSRPMLERALARTKACGLPNASFLLADAQTAELKREEFDLLFSRFGVMFFADPTAAFANLRQALRPGGRLTFVCWQPIQRNPWMLVPALAIARHVPLSPPDPNAPGPFALADPERVSRILSGAHFDEVMIEGVEMSLAMGGGDPERAVDFALEIGPGAAALRAAGAGDALRARAAEDVRKALGPYTENGKLKMPAAFWLVRARALA